MNEHNSDTEAKPIGRQSWITIFHNNLCKEAAERGIELGSAEWSHEGLHQQIVKTFLDDNATLRTANQELWCGLQEAIALCGMDFERWCAENGNERIEACRQILDSHSAVAK